MGPAGKDILREVMTPEDEREMESLPDRYGTERMGKPLVIDAPGGSMTAEFFDHGPDFRVCASSEYANRRKRRRGAAPAPVARAAPSVAAVRANEDAPPSEESFEPVSTPPVRVGKPASPAPERLPDSPPGSPVAVIEAEPPLPSDAGVPETMPKAGPGFAPREAAVPREPPPETPERRAVAAASPRAPLPPAETMPAAGPGLHREPVERGEAALVEDAGTGKPENDPVPELIRRLSAAEPRTRARAADELGKRGAAALPAVPALRRALKDRDRRVRASAVLALGGVGASVDGVGADLRRALRDKNEDVRFSAVIALHRLRAAPEK
ncbi:MAG: HEAT repeat domain-containing protein [Elusimicrobia bacterium]|nr:HEAT repeat domain-containing protein [Elusimicrobiota bacterium]